MNPALDLVAALDPAAVMRRRGLQPDPWQQELLRSSALRHLVLCSRQAGKSTSIAGLALHRAIYRAPALVLLLSPTQRQSGEVFKKVSDFYSLFRHQAPAREETALTLALQNGSRIISLPGKEETIRGYSGASLLILDEASRVADSLYYSVRPMLAVSGGQLVALTTPWGKRGWFHDEWTAGGDSWQRTCITALDVPRISEAFLEEERRTLGDWWFRQEYMCEFVDTTDQLFSYDDIQAAITDEYQSFF